MCLAAYIGFMCVVSAYSATKPSDSHKNFSIIGGNETSISSHPYQVSISFVGSFLCSGAVIHKKFIITSASCISGYRYSTGEVGVRANSSSPLHGGNVFKVKKVHTHPLFSYSTMDYDVALIELEEKFTFSKHLNKIKLAKHDPHVHMKANVSGWGANTTSGFHTDVIKSIQIIVKNATICQTEYNTRNFTNRMFCAESVEYGPCWKDDGDPLVANDQLYGILSRNRGCFEKKYSSVFTKVSVLRRWINRTMKPKRPKKHRKPCKQHINCSKK